MIDKELQADFVKKIRKKSYLSQREFAKTLGVSGAYIGQVETGETALSEKVYKEILRNFTSLANEKENEYIKLDYYPDVKASCGKGNIIASEAKEQIVIPTQTIPNFSTHNKYTVIKATSDSMLPEIKPNDNLVIQHNIDGIIDNHIYIFSFKGELFCKYLSNNLGQIIVRSANTVYPIRYIEGEALNEFRLIGEVKAHIREYEV